MPKPTLRNEYATQRKKQAWFLKAKLGCVFGQPSFVLLCTGSKGVHLQSVCSRYPSHLSKEETMLGQPVGLQTMSENHRIMEWFGLEGTL